MGVTERSMLDGPTQKRMKWKMTWSRPLILRRSGCKASYLASSCRSLSYTDLPTPSADATDDADDASYMMPSHRVVSLTYLAAFAGRGIHLVTRCHMSMKIDVWSDRETEDDPISGRPYEE